MTQYNFYSEGNRLARLSELGDPLESVGKRIDWEIFRPLLETAFYREPKGPGGRPPMDRVMMFKIVMLQQWYAIADDNTEYVINDRLSFQRFLGLTLEDKVPDAKTIWAFKEHLKEKEIERELFEIFNQQMESQGLITRTGSLVDASFAEAPRQRNNRKENKTIKEGAIPEEWLEESSKNKLRQKDIDARWTKKNNELHYGYKNHIKADKESKIILTFGVTAANVHDSRFLYDLLDKKDRVLWADSAYTGEDLHNEIKADYPTIELLINEKGNKNNPLTSEQIAYNREKSRIRARVEHIFGYITNSMKGMRVRCIGINRAIRDITMKNLAYNMQRFIYLTGAAQKVVA